jgi:hypothetical protein
VEYKIAKDPDALLELLAEHERAIARLYRAYASRFDEHAGFWTNLADEELKHSACLNKLRTLSQEDDTFVIVERFSVDAIQFSIRYIEELIERASQPLATKLEESLLEKNFFEVLSGDSQEVQEVLDFLTNETERHSKILIEAQRTPEGPAY